MALRQITVPLISGYDIGVGVDYATGDRRGLAVKQEASTTTGSEGTSGMLRVQRITSTSDLLEQFGVHVEASYGAFFGPNISARFDLGSRASVNTFQLFMAVTGQLEFSTLSIDDPQLTPQAAQLRDSNPQLFAERYGDMFVSALSRGGFIYAFMRIDTKSESEAEDVAGAVSGSYALFKGEADTAFHKQLSRYAGQMAIDLRHEGGPANTTVANKTDPLDLYQTVAAWFNALQNDKSLAVAYDATLSPLSIAGGGTPPNAAALQSLSDLLVNASRLRNTALDGAGQMNHILDRPAEFIDLNAQRVAAVRLNLNNYLNDIQVIGATASRAINDSGTLVSDGAIGFAGVGKSLVGPNYVFPSGGPLIPAVEPIPKIIAYTDPDYGGDSMIIDIGRDLDAAAQNLLIGNDALSSLRVPSGSAVRLYEHSWFQGAWIDVTADEPSLGTFDNKTSSLRTYSVGATVPLTNIVSLWLFNLGDNSNAWFHFGIGDHGLPNRGRMQLFSWLVPAHLKLELFDGAGQGQTLLDTKLDDNPAIYEDVNLHKPWLEFAALTVSEK